MSSRDIDLRLLLTQVWKDKLLIIFFVTIFAITSVIAALSLENLYRSDIKLYPNESSGSDISSMSSQLGGLASLAGVELGGADNKVHLAIQTLKSREFISMFINKYNLKAAIIAEEHWDFNSNMLFYDQEMYNSEKELWVREVTKPFKVTPSDQEAYKEFIENHLILREEADVGIWVLTIEHISPYIAQEIATNLVKEINSQIRQSDMEEAEASLLILQDALKNVELVDMKNMLFELIQQNAQKKLLAEVREEYVFRVVDPAIVPEIKYSPSRALLCVIGIFLGFVIGIFISVTRCILQSER
jgi:LPS O-antigen subunit length determinant protein (WzzB/FepE family)